MIIIKPCCGLGNQMFLYAAARSLAEKHKADLFIDESYYSGITQSDLPEGAGLRDYELSIFNIKAEAISGYESKICRRVRSRSLYKRIRAFVPCLLANYFGLKKNILCFSEKGPEFDKTVFKLPDNVFLEGYYVSYKYFEHCADIIRDDFSFLEDPDPQNSRLIDEISSVDSVSVHIRRGDYVTNKVVLDVFGICSVDYYKRAVDFIAGKVKSPHFYIFSDDPQWVRDNIKIKHPTVYVSYNVGTKNYEDLRLMSLCKHNIIANSSFSWWGAWLNKNPEKIVIGPSPAFDKLNIRDDDFYPAGWLRLQKDC